MTLILKISVSHPADYCQMLFSVQASLQIVISAVSVKSVMYMLDSNELKVFIENES